MVLIAFLVKAGRRDALKWVWAGVAAAVAMTVGVFLAIQYGAYTIKDLAAEAIAGVASLVAVAIVTSMVLWMRSAAAGLSGELRAGMSRGHWRPAPWRYSCSPSSPSAGRAWRPRCSWSATPRPNRLAAAGAADRRPGGGGHRGRHVRRRGADQPGQFFTYTGAFLIVVAAGILSYGVGALQTVGGCRTPAAGRSTSAPGSTGRPGTARSSRASSTSPRRRRYCSWSAG